MRYSKSQNAGIGHLNLTLGAGNIIWTFLFHFSFVSSASWLVLGGVMSARCQAAIALLRMVFSCDGWLQHAVLISCIRIICLHGSFFVSWAGSCMRDDCYMGCTHRLLQDNLILTVHPMFTEPNMFGVWQHAVLDKDCTSPMPDLPKCLCEKLPIGASAAKQKHKAKPMELWKWQWSKSKHFTHLLCIDSFAPSKQFMWTILPKSQAGTMYQLHLGHIALNQHLHCINKSDTPLCLQCKVGTPETAHHLLFECTCYDREWHILRNKLGREALSTSYLLVGNSMGMGNPRGSWVWVSCGYGYG